MDAHAAAKLLGDQTRGRRTHAPAGDRAALCGAELGGTVATDVDPEDVTCRACRARLRDTGALPMTEHARRRRVGRS